MQIEVGEKRGGMGKRVKEEVMSPVKKRRSESPAVSEPTSSGDSEMSEESADAGPSRAVKEWKELSPQEIEAVLEKMTEKELRQPIKSSGRWATLSAKDSDGRQYPKVFLRKELLRYWRLVSQSEAVTLKTLKTLWPVYANSAVAVSRFPDYPKMPKRSAYFEWKAVETNRRRAELQKKYGKRWVMSSAKEMSDLWKAQSAKQKAKWSRVAYDKREEDLEGLREFVQRHPTMVVSEKALERAEKRQKAMAKQLGLTSEVSAGAEEFFREKKQHYAAKYDLPEGSGMLRKRVLEKWSALSEERQAKYQNKALEATLGSPEKAKTPKKKKAETPKTETVVNGFQNFMSQKGLHYSEKYGLPIDSPDLHRKISRKWERLDKDEQLQFNQNDSDSD